MASHRPRLRIAHTVGAVQRARHKAIIVLVWLLISGVIGWIASVLMAACILGLDYGGFTYTEATYEASIGSVSLSIDDKRRVNIPIWAGVGMLAVGGLIFANGLKRGESRLTRKL